MWAFDVIPTYVEIGGQIGVGLVKFTKVLHILIHYV